MRLFMYRRFVQQMLLISNKNIGDSSQWFNDCHCLENPLYLEMSHEYRYLEEYSHENI